MSGAGIIRIAVTAIAALSMSAGAASAARFEDAPSPLAYQELAHAPLGSTVLYDQTAAFDFNGPLENHYPPGQEQLDSEGADDFVVTDASGWTVTEFDLRATSFSGIEPDDFAPPPEVVDIVVYADADGMPGAGIACAAIGTSTTFDTATAMVRAPLSTPCVFPRGRFWLAVAWQADTGVYPGLWGTTTTLHGAPGFWRNEGGALPNCNDWTPLQQCFSGGEVDFAFAVIGHAGGTLGLTVGLSDDGSCGSAMSLAVTVGDPVTFCYVVTNTTGPSAPVELNYHSLADDLNGTLIDGLDYALDPGASYQYRRTIVAGLSQQPASNWAASDVAPDYVGAAGSYAFVDITQSGTALGLDANGSANVAMPFSFNFAGTTSNQLCINDNGLIVFARSTTCDGFAYNDSLPVGDLFGGPAILPYWTDLQSGGDAYYATLGVAPNRRFVVEWSGRDASGCPDMSGVTFEAILDEAGQTVDFEYGDTTCGSGGDDGAMATAGLDFGDGRAEEYSYDDAVLSNGVDVHWTGNGFRQFDGSAQVNLDVGAPALDLNPTSLSVQVGAGQAVTRTLHIANSGTRELTWALSTAQSDGPSRENALGAAVPAYGEYIDNNAGTVSFASLDAAAPGDVELIAPESNVDIFYGGTFIDNDFGREYVLASPSETLERVDTTTGAVIPIGWTGLPSEGILATSLRWDASSSTLYAPVVSALPDKRASFLAKSAAPNGTHVGTTLYEVDPVTGAATPIAPITGVGDANGNVLVYSLAIDAEGQLFGIESQTAQLIGIDKTTGIAHAIGPSGFPSQSFQSMDFDQASGTLYAVSYDQNAMFSNVYTIDPLSGTPTLVGPLGSGSGVAMGAFAIAVPGGPCATQTDIPWLSYAPSGGELDPGMGIDVALTLDATMLAPGSYSANLCVGSNMPFHGESAVPVTLVVTASGDEIFSNGFEN